MKISKVFFTLILTAISIGHVYAQVASNPYVNGAAVNPAPLPAPGAPGSNNVCVSFNFGNGTSTPIPLNTLNVVNISLSKLAVNGAFSPANVTVLDGDYFTFTYNSTLNTIVATQKAPIPGYATEKITICNLIITDESTRANPQNGLNVNVAFLASVNPNQVDDNTNAFTYTGSGGALPIRLVTFNGVKDDTKVQLKWQTSSEQNSKHFEVEFSENGNQWSNIGTVQAAGNSTVQRNYGLVHNSPVDGANYYRLKQVDATGNYSYSNIVAINFTIKGVKITSVFPNPFISQLKIKVSSDRNEVVRIQLSDNAGRVLRVQNASIQKGVSDLSIDNLAGLAPGIYNVEVKTSFSTFRYKLKK